MQIASETKFDRHVAFTAIFDQICCVSTATKDVIYENAEAIFINIYGGRAYTDYNSYRNVKKRK